MHSHRDDPDKIIHPWDVAYKLWKGKEPKRYSTQEFGARLLGKSNLEELPEIVKIGLTRGQRLFASLFFCALGLGVPFIFLHAHDWDLQKLVAHVLALVFLIVLEVFLIGMAWIIDADDLPDLCISKAGLEIKNEENSELHYFSWDQIASTEIIVVHRSSNEKTHKLHISFHKETELKDLTVALTSNKTYEEIAYFVERYKQEGLKSGNA